MAVGKSKSFFTFFEKMCRVLLVEHDRGKGKIGRGNRERTGCGGSRKVSVAQASDTLAQAEDRSLFGSCFCGTAVWSYCVVCESGLAQLTPLQRLCALSLALPPPRTHLSTHPCLLQRTRSVDALFCSLKQRGFRSLKVLPPFPSCAALVQICQPLTKVNTVNF